MTIPCQAQLHPVLGINMWLSEQDHNFDSLWDQKEVGFDKMSEMDVYNFLHIVSSVGGINSNPACLGEEVDLMEMDGIKSNLAWQEIKVDNLMEVDEKSNLIRLGKKQKSINLMKMDEAADHHLREEVDLMEMDGIKSNLAWQEIEVDNLMELDEVTDWMKKT